MKTLLTKLFRGRGTVLPLGPQEFKDIAPSKRHIGEWGYYSYVCTGGDRRGEAIRLRWVTTRLTEEKYSRGWGDRDPDGKLQVYYQYFCNDCGGELTPGPTGGGTNQVCETCRINFGCLNGALMR